MPDAGAYEGLLYRALNPFWAREPLSGEGAARHGGRFNPRGTPALYTALSIPTVLREANQVGHLQPTTLIAIEARITGLFDSRDVAALAAHGMTPEALADNGWRAAMQRGQAPTQVFARRLIAAGYTGLLVRSYARGASDEDMNLVLWRWGTQPPADLRLIDDEGRLR